MYTNINQAIAIALNALGPANPTNVRLIMNGIHADAVHIRGVLASEADATGVALRQRPSHASLLSFLPPGAMSPFLSSLLTAAFHAALFARVQEVWLQPATVRIPVVERAISDVQRHVAVVALQHLENTYSRMVSSHIVAPEMPAPAPVTPSGPAADEPAECDAHMRYLYRNSLQTSGVEFITSTGLARSYSSVGPPALSVIYKAALAHNVGHLTVSQWLPRDALYVLFSDAPIALASLTVVMGARPPHLRVNGVELCSLLQYRGSGWAECRARPTLTLMLPEDFGGGIEVDEEEICAFMDAVFPREVGPHDGH